MGTQPETQGSSGSPTGNFRKVSKPLMEKKRRARINVSLEQLKSLLEKHYSHQIRKRKLEKADILELSVKYMKSLQNSVYISLFLLHLPYSPLLSTFLSSAALLLGLWPVPSGAEYPSGFRGCLPGVSQLLRRGEEGGAGLHGPLVHERGGGSTMDSASPGPEAPARRGPCAPPVWAPAPAPGGSRSPPPRRLLSGGLPGASTSISAPQSTSRRFAESPGPGLRLWRPW
ncbi:hypothetical protein CapIbe_013873 [Capra ibex]